MTKLNTTNSFFIHLLFCIQCLCYVNIFIGKEIVREAMSSKRIEDDRKISEMDVHHDNNANHNANLTLTAIPVIDTLEMHVFKMFLHKQVNKQVNTKIQNHRHHGFHHEKSLQRLKAIEHTAVLLKSLQLYRESDNELHSFCIMVRVCMCRYVDICVFVLGIGTQVNPLSPPPHTPTHSLIPTLHLYITIQYNQLNTV